MFRWTGITALALLLLLGCDGGSSVTGESNFSRPSESDFAPAVEPALGSAARPPAKESRPEPAVDPPMRPLPTKAQWELSPAARAMAEAVSEAASEVSGDACEHSFNTLKALARTANRAVPRRADYLQACGELSPDMQRCLDPAYREDHNEECLRAHSRTDRGILGRLERLIEGSAE